MKKSLLLILSAAALWPRPRLTKSSARSRSAALAAGIIVYVDSANHRLYVSHGTQTEVIDTATDKLVGTIPGTNGVHGIAIAGDLGSGFTSDGGDNDVTVFDLKTLKVLSKVKTGQNPDSIIYEPVTHRVFTFNGRSNDSTAIDAKTGDVITASIPRGRQARVRAGRRQRPHLRQYRRQERDHRVDAKNALVAKRYSIAPCDSPSGLAIDPKGRLYSVCENKMMIVSDPAAGKVLATPAIGAGTDGVAFDDGYAFSANGADGTITMVGETSPGKFEPVATIPEPARARAPSPPIRRRTSCICPTAEYGPASGGQDGKKGRPPALPDSFKILVVGR